ncbi:MAG: metal-sensitive transcriptional regulator [bacterium]|nr:metal-sensitive transcriptional regulator [bacterium]
MKKEIKGKLSKRLKIIEGQIRGLQKLIEDDTYCVDVITQTSAVRNALFALEGVILENHLSTHVVEQMKSGKHQKAVAEILSVYKLAHKK